MATEQLLFIQIKKCHEITAKVTCQKFVTNLAIGLVTNRTLPSRRLTQCVIEKYYLVT